MEVKVGDIVMLLPRVTVKHMLEIWLRFDERQVAFLRRAKFRADEIFQHTKFGLVTRASMYWSPPLPPGVWVDWCDENYIKLCYLEVVDGS